ncbi:MAG: hypothetical protein IH626_02465, partial [Rhodospirillales bacterium]|nr:hypothetical protein [Rhodospirillales bacterium]
GPEPAPGPGRPEALLGRLADHIGLAPDVVIRHGAKIPAEEFAARLLEAEGRLLSLYDASIDEPAPHPAAGRTRDSRLARISAAVTAAFNDEIRTRLGVTTDLTYHVLNRRVGAQWSWENGDWGGGPGAAENLERAMKTVPGMTALIAHGLYDLVTPYFATRFLAGQLDLPADLRRRLTLATYEGGHMFYSHTAARTAFTADARRFYGEMVDAGP